jgi:hypothetical protein
MEEGDMGNDDRALRQLEDLIGRLQRHAGRGDDRGGWPGFVGGLLLGTALGAALALVLAGRDEPEEEEAPAAGDAIVLRERTEGERDEARDEAPAPRTLAATAPGGEQPGTPAGDEPEVPDQLAAAELESPEALTEIAEQAEAEEVAPAGEEVGESAPAAPATGGDAAAAATAAATAAPAASAAPSPAGGTGAPARGQTEPVEGECPASHPIKGNRGSMGALIYHLPGTANYDRTNPEVCFATEADAEAAGYRAPRL